MMFIGKIHSDILIFSKSQNPVNHRVLCVFKTNYTYQKGVSELANKKLIQQELKYFVLYY